MADYNNFKKYIPIVLLIIVIILSFLVLKPFLGAIFLGALLAYLFYPVYQKINSKLNSTVAAALVCVIVFLIIVIPSVFFVKSLIQESFVFYLLVKQKLAMGLFSNCHYSICETIKSMSQNPEISYQIQETTRNITGWIVSKSSEFVVSIPRFIINLVVIFFSLFYFLKDGTIFLSKMNSYLNLHEHHFSKLVSRLKEVIHGLTYGYLVIAVIQGITSALGFFIFGISSPIFWGSVIAFLALVPYVGAGIVWIPTAAILIIDGLIQNSNWLLVQGILFFFYGMIFISGVDLFLKPKIIGQKTKTHPLIIFLGIVGGVFVFGVLGVIVGPLLLSIATLIIDTYILKK